MKAEDRRRAAERQNKVCSVGLEDSEISSEEDSIFDTTEAAESADESGPQEPLPTPQRKPWKPMILRRTHKADMQDHVQKMNDNLAGIVRLRGMPCKKKPFPGTDKDNKSHRHAVDSFYDSKSRPISEGRRLQRVFGIYTL